uniref:Uncharacterized protein n=1 Tax=Helianthus annuus TaxID=4232 RepID=A0A251VF84_HELAN
MLVSIQRVQRTSDQRDIDGICDDGHHDRSLRLHFGNGDIEESSDTSSGLNTPCEREPKNAKLTHESSITKHKSSQWDCLNGSDPKVSKPMFRSKSFRRMLRSMLQQPEHRRRGRSRSSVSEELIWMLSLICLLMSLLSSSLLVLAEGVYMFQRGLKRKPMALIKKLRKAVTLRKQRSLFIHLVG